MTAVPIPTSPIPLAGSNPKAAATRAPAYPRIQSHAGIAASIDDLKGFLANESEFNSGIVGSSPQLNRVLHVAQQYAHSSAPVLISGESGTGKELVAKMIHVLSGRRDKPYLQINCAALSEGLIESELFGHEKGAFTGADSARTGKFEAADGGTLLLDEIGEMPQQLQAKLLRVLEQFEFQRVGGNTPVTVNTRIIDTTNRVLSDEVERNTFRLDLFHRLSVLNLTIPPLRERRADISELVSAFVHSFQSESVVSIQAISTAAMQVLIQHDWLGNVRELRNAIRHACVVNATGTLEATDFPDSLRSAGTPVIRAQPVALRRSDPFQELAEQIIDLPLDEIEERVIAATLARFDGNKAAAARHLGITARTISNKLQRYSGDE